MDFTSATPEVVNVEGKADGAGAKWFDDRSEDMNLHFGQAPRRTKPANGKARRARNGTSNLDERFVTPGYVKQPQKNLFQSAHKEEINVDDIKEVPWQNNMSELSPDSRELFEDLEEAERGQQIMNNNLGCFSSIHKNKPNPNIYSSSSSVMYSFNTEMVDERYSHVDTSVLETPDARSHVQRTHEFAAHQSNVQSIGATDASLLSGNGSFSPGDIFIQNLTQRTPSQRLSFSGAGGNFITPGLASRSVPEVQVISSNSDVIDLSTPGVGAAARNTETAVEDLTREKSDAELMDESERLARQLMEEEEALLCQRIQQEQIRIISEMRQTQRAESEDTSGDMALALRLAEENEGEDDDINPDDMSYDELLQLGEQIGDVKQERWRIEGKEAVSSLKVISFCPPCDSKKVEDDEYAYIYESSDPTCVICQYSFEVDDRLKVLPCKHAFHNDCIDAWLKDHDTCVVCKRSITETS